MPRTRPPYPPEFREQIVALVRAGRMEEITGWYVTKKGDAGRHWRRSVRGRRPAVTTC